MLSQLHFGRPDQMLRAEQALSQMEYDTSFSALLQRLGIVAQNAFTSLCEIRF